MAADPNKLYVLAALRQVGVSYSFVVRWLPGASDDPSQGDNLPTAADIFTVTIRRPGAGLWLQADLTWAANAYGFDIRPRPYAMIDPPRRASPIPDAPNQQAQWLVASEPTAPVDPTLAQLRIDSTSSAAMGVCHLLDNLDKDRIAYRIWQCLSATASSYSQRTSRGTIAFTEAEAQRETARLAVRLVREARRPRHLPHILAADHERLRTRTAVAEAAGRMDDEAASLAVEWRRLAFTAALIEDEAALLAADYEYRSGTQTRQQLRLKAIQGGDLIDFWSGLDKPIQAPPAADRGRAYSSSVLLGLGVDLGAFSAAEVQSWCAPLLNGSSDFVSLEVSHRLDPNHARTFGIGRGSTGHLKVKIRHDYDPGSTLLKRQDLERALAEGSSNPPLRPAKARVNYDLTKSWSDPTSDVKPAEGEGDTSLNFTTGDGRIEILIAPAQPRVDPNGRSMNTVVGYNVYGVWEGASATSDVWFQAGHEPSLSELRPWLISRRYSLYRDLAPALPPINGTAHPNLAAALAAPPWHPVLQRTTNLVDAASGKNEPLPSVTNTEQGGAVRLAVFGYDLRRGAQQAPTLPPGIPGAWDPVYPPKPKWTPEVWRSETVARARPQGYRFWVTAVDSMGQESPPLAVAAEDAEAGQAPTTIFTPMRRTQLRAPPRPSDDDPEALSLKEVGDRVALRVTFVSPHELLLGSNAEPGEPGDALDPVGLRAIVQVLRRRLKANVDDASLTTFTASDPVLDSKTWRNARSLLLAQGWEAWADSAIDSPSQGKWTAEFPLRFADRSFEYVALAGFAVKGSALAFWHPTAQLRTVQVTRNVAPQGKPPDFRLFTETIEEAPRVGVVATSVTLTIKADAPARAAEVAHMPFQLGTADPILPPPSVNRDTVLMRLISQPVKVGETPVPARPWPDDAGPWLRAGQIATCEAALARTHFEQVSNVPAPGPTEQQILRRALARLCAGDAPSKRLVRNPMIGFRGVAALSWRYRPLAIWPPKVGSAGKPMEAEASLFRIFTAGAPYSAQEAQSAPVQASLRFISNGRYEVTGFTGDAGVISALTSNTQPALVRIATSPEPTFANLLRFEATGGAMYAELSALDGQLPGSGAPTVPAQVYLGRIVRELPNERYDSDGECNAWVPVPGGPAEIIAWWVSAVSAEQRVASQTSISWPVMAQRFDASVQPRPPGQFSSRAVQGVSDLKYDPTTPEHKNWCPRNLDVYGAEFLPRLYLTWEKPDAWVGASGIGGKLYIEIDREYVRASQPSSKFTLAASDVTPWQAIRSIETMTSDQSIDMTWIDAIRENWLLGREVEVTAQLVDDPAFIRADLWPLVAAGVPVGPSPQPNVAVRFIDYFAQPNSNREVVMESDYRYRYRARYAQELGTSSGWKFLRSEWTDWSELILPVSPDLSPHPVQSTILAFPEVAPPRVRFVITSKPLALRFARHHEAFRRSDVDWLYRVMIYRQTRSLLTKSSGGEPGLDWIEVGSALTLKPDGMEVLVDDGFERSAYGEPLSLKYRLILLQFIRDEASMQERPVRTSKDGFLDFTVNVPAPIVNKGAVHEVEITELFNVR